MFYLSAKNNKNQEVREDGKQKTKEVTKGIKKQENKQEVVFDLTMSPEFLGFPATNVTETTSP